MTIIRKHVKKFTKKQVKRPLKKASTNYDNFWERYAEKEAEKIYKKYSESNNIVSQTLYHFEKFLYGISEIALRLLLNPS